MSVQQQQLTPRTGVEKIKWYKYACEESADGSIEHGDALQAHIHKNNNPQKDLIVLQSPSFRSSLRRDTVTNR